MNINFISYAVIPTWDSNGCVTKAVMLFVLNDIMFWNKLWLTESFYLKRNGPKM